METEHRDNLSDAANAHFNEGDGIIDKKEEKIQTSTKLSDSCARISYYYQQYCDYLAKCQKSEERTCKSSMLETLGKSRPSAPEAERRKIDEEEMKNTTYTLIQSMEEYEAAVNHNVRVICHFYKDDDLECKVMDLFSSKLAEQHPEAPFLRIDAGKHPDLAAQLKIKDFPTVALVKRGEWVTRKVGPEIKTVGSDDPEGFVERMCRFFWD